SIVVSRPESAGGPAPPRSPESRAPCTDLTPAVRLFTAVLETCIVVPVKPGKEEALRDFYREVDGPRRDDYDRSEQRLGITKEIAWSARTDGGRVAVIYIES